jgi:methionyl-tRNA formyltransferase
MHPTTTTDKTNKLKIVFMGTPDFAAHILEHLIEHQYDVVGVVTVADKPAGRGKKIRYSAVKELALAKELPLLQPENLKDAHFISELSSFNADVFVVVAFRMLPKIVWEMPPKGCFNLHASLLPDYRGAAPINWAIINNEKKTGVTTFFIDEKIDTGAIIDQRELPIEEHESAGSLHDKLMLLGAELASNTLDQIESGTATTREQQAKNPKEAPKLFKDNCRIDWNESCSTIYNKIRGLAPYPSAWSNVVDQDKQLTVKIYEAEPLTEVHSLKAGSILRSKKELKVATPDGFISLKSIQLPGKKRMAVKDLLNGLNWSNESYML